MKYNCVHRQCRQPFEKAWLQRKKKWGWVGWGMHPNSTGYSIYRET